MSRSGWLLGALMLAVFPATSRAAEYVRSENGRFWIECRNAPLQDVLREIAGIVPIELWLDEGIQNKEVSVSLAGVAMREALVKLFEGVKVNYVLYLDPANRERVAKIYVGAGEGSAGRLGREPTVSSEAAAGSRVGESVAGRELPPELDLDRLLESPETQEVLGALRSFLEQQNAAGSDEPDADDPGAALAVPPALQELLEKVSQFPRSRFTPGIDAPPPSQSPPKEKKEKPQPQL